MGLFSSDPTGAWRDELAGFSAEFEALRSEDGERLHRAQTYREEIEATRDPSRPVGGRSEGDYGRRAKSNTSQLQRHNFKFPIAQALTVKHAYRISGRMPDPDVPRREENASERYRSDTMEKIWWAVTDCCDGEVQFADAAWDASQIGSAAFDVYYNFDHGMPVYRAFDTGSCVVVRGLDDPHRFERVYRWWDVPISTFRASWAGQQFRDALIPLGDVQAMDGQNSITIVEMCDANRRLRFARSARTNIPAVGLKERVHNYGFTPAVVIPNLGPHRKVFGWSDYDFVREVCAYINQFFGREADIIRAVANGSMKLKGGKLAPLQVLEILQSGGILPLGRDGELEPVQAPEVPAFSVQHGERAFDLLERLGFAPPAAWGAIGAASGSDRGLQLQPLFELTSLKQKNWSASLSRLGSMIYQIVEKNGGEKVSYTGARKRGSSRAFSMMLGTSTAPIAAAGQDGLPQEFPTNPKDIFQGEYRVRFQFADRIDFDDPSYVASELNKFAQGVQSARTTLERLGHEAPEDELKLIEQESELYPWLRQGMLKLLEMQLGADQSGQNDGSQNFDPAQAQMGALQGMNTKDGAALDTDAATGALQGGVGQLYGGA